MHGTHLRRAEQYSYPKTLGMGLLTPITNCFYSGLLLLLAWTAFSVRPAIRRAYRQSSSLESRSMRLPANTGRNSDEPRATPKVTNQSEIHHQAENGSDDQALTEARVILRGQPRQAQAVSRRFLDRSGAFCRSINPEIQYTGLFRGCTDRAAAQTERLMRRVRCQHRRTPTHTEWLRPLQTTPYRHRTSGSNPPGDGASFGQE